MERLGSPPLLARLDAMLKRQAERFGGQPPRPVHRPDGTVDPATHEASSSRP